MKTIECKCAECGKKIYVSNPKANLDEVLCSTCFDLWITEFQ
jgi:formylmethanofuran dehydrogenase subunit E